MLPIIAIWGTVIGTLGLVMAFARTGPDEARSKLSEWANFLGFKKAASWLSEHAIDRRVLRYGKWAVMALLFVGGMLLQSWLNGPPSQNSNHQIAPQTFGFAEATMPPRAPERSIGSTFSIQLAQTLLGLPQPCLIKLTDPSATEIGQTISWILRYGNIPSGPTCQIQPNDVLENADNPLTKPTTEAGIVVHWKAEHMPGERIAHFLDSTGAKVRISHQLDAGVPNNLIWIDVGPGSPWK